MQNDQTFAELRDRELVSQVISKVDYRTVDHLEGQDDPVMRFWHRPVIDTAGQAPYWEALVRILESSYGYRHQKQSGRLTRRAPSAGSMYPLEIVVVPPMALDAMPVLYSFENQRFFQLSEVAATDIHRACGLSGDDTLLLEVAFFQRTIRRYGVRGYRYCLLDGGALLVNLAGFAQRAGLETRVLSGAIIDILEDVLELERDEGGLVCLALSGLINSEALPMPERLADTPHCIAPRVQGHPDLPAMLDKISRYHRQSLLAPASIRHELTPAAAGSLRCTDLLEQRFSAKDFVSVSLCGERILAELTLLWRDSELPLTQQVAPLQVHVLAFTLAGREDCVLRAEAVDGLQLVRTQTDLRAHFRAACQSQSLLGRCAFAVIISARKESLYASPMVYRHTCLNAGYLDMLQQYVATELELGNTCIGGFDDAAVAQLLGDETLTPLVIHAFGVAADGVKVDAAQDRMKASYAF